MGGRRPASVEFRIERSGGRAGLVFRPPRPVRAALAAGGLLLLGILLVAAAMGPRAISALRVRREVATQLVRRTQLGERLRILVESLHVLEARSLEMQERIRRYERVYGLRGDPGEQAGARRERQEGASGTIFAAAISHGAALAERLETRVERLDRAVATVAEWERSHPEVVNVLPLGLPLPAETSVPTSGFGTRRSTADGELEFHAGLDLAAPVGTEIRVPADGLVLWAGEPPTRAGSDWWRLGRTIVVRHGEHFLTLYGHCDRVEVRRGRRVRRGDRIGRVGSSGWAAAPQLHYEIRRVEGEDGWVALDPRLFLAASPDAPPAPAEAAGGVPAPPQLPRDYRR